MFASVMLPQSGEKFPPGFNPSSPSLDDFRVKSYPTFEKVVSVRSLDINKEFDPRFFTIEFPKGTPVYDELTRKAYIVGDVSSKIEAELAALANKAQKSKSPDSAGWMIPIASLVLTGCLAFMGVFWVVYTRRKRRSDSMIQ